MTAVDRALSVEDLRELARAGIDQALFEYCTRGAEDEVALERNVEAFRAASLRPKVLAGTGAPDLRVRVFGRTIELPVMVAPVGLQQMVHPEAEAASACAAAAAGTIFCISMFSSRSLEEIAAAAPECRRWFQVYPVRDRALIENAIERAQELGCEAVVVTVDYPEIGRREHDLRRNLARFVEFPPALFAEPSFQAASGPEGPVARLHEIFPNPFASWQDVAWLVSRVRVPVVVKGILRSDDARRAADVGAAAIVVSNHGGRQLDRAVAPIDVLPEIASAVDDTMEVYLDSGVRRGSDIFVALSRGARAVLVGRAMLWGLAAGGEAGVFRAFEILRAEFATTMALMGAPSPDQLDSSFLVPARATRY